MKMQTFSMLYSRKLSLCFCKLDGFFTWVHNPGKHRFNIHFMYQVQVLFAAASLDIPFWCSNDSRYFSNGRIALVRTNKRNFLPTQSKFSKLKPSGGPWCTYRWPIQLIGRYDAAMSGWEVVIKRKNENELSYQINDVIIIDPGCTSVLPPWPISLSLLQRKIWHICQ